MARLLIAVGMLALIAVNAQAQSCGVEPAGAKQIDSPQLTLSFRTEPPKIAVGKHFAVEVVVCPKAGGAAADRIKIDAVMPDHRHGMNYKPSIKSLGDGRFRADGMMFHMPGRWEFQFDVEGKDGNERLTSSMVLR